MKKTEQLTISGELSGQRLDVAISQYYSDFSRTNIQALIKSGDVRLNNSAAKPRTKVVSGDKIEISFVIEPQQPSKLLPTALDFPILFEDEYLIAIDKPANLVVHPGAGKETETVVSAILSHTSLSSIGLPFRPGVVQRLDKETTGVMLLAKTNVAHRALASSFSKHQVTKEYLAVLQGIIKTKKGKIETAIERDRVHRKRMKVTADNRGKPAITTFETIEHFVDSTLVKVNILTGRTHQIRVHMAFTDHPLLGDTLYGAHKTSFIHLLHSSKIIFKHPITKNNITLEAPLPQNFSSLLDQLRTNSYKSLSLKHE